MCAAPKGMVFYLFWSKIGYEFLPFWSEIGRGLTSRLSFILQLALKTALFYPWLSFQPSKLIPFDYLFSPNQLQNRAFHNSVTNYVAVMLTTTTKTMTRITIKICMTAQIHAMA